MWWVVCLASGEMNGSDNVSCTVNTFSTPRCRFARLAVCFSEEEEKLSAFGYHVKVADIRDQKAKSGSTAQNATPNLKSMS